MPFFNKQNYVVVKCYTPFDLMKEHKTVDISSKNLDVCASENKKQGASSQVTFSHCYGMIHSKQRSITIKAPSELKAISDGDKWHYKSPNHYFGPDADGSHDNDPHFNSGDCFITKLFIPWRFEEKTGAKFLYARHIQNTTFMNIPSGVLNLRNVHNVPIFNYIPRINLSYDVDFLHPLMSLYLLDDKKLIVETSVDREKFIHLEEQSRVKAFFKANHVKLDKLQDKQKANKFCPFQIGEKC